MPDTHDAGSSEDEDAALEVAQYADRYAAYGDGRSDMDPGRPPVEAMWRVRKQLRHLRKQLAAATACAEKVEAAFAARRLYSQRYRAERDKARRLLDRIVGAVEHAHALNTYVELESGETAPTVESLRAEVRAILDGDQSDWTAAEDAEFEQRYGVEAAMRLQSANNRVWQIVQDLRTEAVAFGRDPYQDPMAQRLSAALAGVDHQHQPQTIETEKP